MVDTNPKLTDENQTGTTEENTFQAQSKEQANQETTDATSSTTDKRLQNQSSQRIRSVILLQVFLAILMILVGIAYNNSHDIRGWFNLVVSGDNRVVFTEKMAAFNFLGVDADNPVPSFWAVMFEVLAWSFFGVLARSEYYLTQIVVQRKNFVLWETVSKIIGDHAMGGAIAMAVVAFLRSTGVNVGSVNLTLATADIGLVIAISFILGFYHEDTRRLLGRFQKGISSSIESSREERDAG